MSPGGPGPQSTPDRLQLLLGSKSPFLGAPGRLAPAGVPASRCLDSVSGSRPGTRGSSARLAAGGVRLRGQPRPPRAPLAWAGSRTPVPPPHPETYRPPGSLSDHTGSSPLASEAPAAVSTPQAPPPRSPGPQSSAGSRLQQFRGEGLRGARRTPLRRSPSAPGRARPTPFRATRVQPRPKVGLQGGSFPPLPAPALRAPAGGRGAPLPSGLAWPRPRVAASPVSSPTTTILGGCRVPPG